MGKLQASAVPKIYAQIMDEMHTRLRTGYAYIRKCIDDKDGPESYVHYESSCLQLRKVCELLAVALLVAHNDIPNISNRVMQEWNAEKLFKMLSRLNASSFPVAARLVPRGDGEKNLVLQEEGHLSQADILQMYTKRCQLILHAGNMEDLLNVRRNYDIDEVAKFYLALGELLKMHVVFLPAVNSAMMTVMHQLTIGRARSSVLKIQEARGGEISYLVQTMSP